MDATDVTQQQTPREDLQALYIFLQRNLERKGYEDALVNPDTSVMEEHVQFIKSELLLYISRVKTFYTGYMRDIEFHIETRKRNGLIETVEELNTHHKNIADEFRTVLSIEDDTKENNGASQSLTLGYRIGFRNGFAAITYNTILGKQN